jgi:ATP-binding cassette subfamily B protein
LELLERNSDHFQIRCAADSPAVTGADALLNRAERTRARVLQTLDLHDSVAELVPIYLTDLAIDPDSGAQMLIVEGTRGIVATYRQDAPAVGLEGAIAEALLGHRVRSAALLDGIVGLALADAPPRGEDIQRDLTAFDIHVATLLHGRDDLTPQVYSRVASSLVGFLIARFGSQQVRRLVATLDPTAPDAAFLSICGASTETIEATWVESLQHTEADVPGARAVLRRCASFLRPYWLLCLIIGVCLLIATAFDLLLPLSFRFLIDNAILPGNYALMAAIIGGLLVLFLAQTLATLVREYLAARVGANVLNELRAQLFAHLNALSPGYFARTQTGDLLARYSSDLAPLDLVLTRMVPVGLSVLLGLAGSVILMFALDWRLALVTLILLPGFAVGPALLGRRAARASYQRQRVGGVMLSAAQESISGQLVIRAFGLEEFFSRRFAHELDLFRSATIRSSFLGALLGAGGGISMSLTQVISLGLGAFFVARGDMSVGALVAFQGLLANVVGPLRELSQIADMLQQASGALQRLDEVLDQRPSVADAVAAVALPAFASEIRFDHVSFAYEDGTPALHDVSFDIAAGESVAIVGPSGCGKSTVLNLLMRNYDPIDGSVSVDGCDLRAVTQRSLRQQLGVVFQDTALFDMSVRDNIRLGRLEASDAEVEAAARLAEVDTVIRELPGGYATQVGERGGRLSGGQRQRIALARALLRGPRLLVLDEPTSALDPETEAAVNATLERVREERTTVTVTHRLGSVVAYDQIIVLERGRVVQRGTHAELVNEVGVYQRLWQQGQRDGDSTASGVERLRDVPYLRGLDVVLLSAVAERMSHEERAPGETFFAAGDPGDAFYLVVDGQVDVLVPRAGGEDVCVNVLRDGDYFGEIALVESVPRTATVRARTTARTLSIDREQFLRLLERLPRLRDAFETTIRARRAVERELLRSAG